MGDGSLIWVNQDGTVLVTRYEDGATIYVATREDSDDLWDPPIACNADAETAKIMGVAREAAETVAARWDADVAAGEVGMGDN